MARGDRRSMYLQQYKAAFFSCSRFTKMAGNGELALWRGRAVQSAPGKRCALFEPFEKPQDKLREFARRWACPEQRQRSRRTAKGPEELAPAEAGGHATTCMVLATFAEKKVARRPGRDQALPNAKIKFRHGVKDKKARKGNSLRGMRDKNSQCTRRIFQNTF